MDTHPASIQALNLAAYRANAPAAFEKLLEVLPFSLAVRETMRMRALADLGALRMPMLDVGCGDGLIWETVTRNLPKDEGRYLSGLLGIDINPRELPLASMRLHQRGATVEMADISNTDGNTGLGRMGGSFQTVLANCSLEHVPRLEPALQNIRECLTPDGDFLLFVPAPNWTDAMRVKQRLERVSHRLAGLVGGALDGFFQHHHLYPEFVWRHLLSGAGFKHVEMVGIGSRAANLLFETHLPPAFASFVVKAILHRYPDTQLDRFFTHSRLFKEFLVEVETGGFIQRDLRHPEVIEYFIRCRR